MSHRLKLALTACAAALGLASTAHAEATMDKHAGLLMVNVRLTDVDPSSGSAITAGGVDTGLKTDVSSSVIPSLGITYFFTDNIAAELIAGTSHHTIKAVGPGTDVVVRKTWVLPPTLSLQYHFNPKGQISPYVGAGLNYMIFYSGHDYNGFTTKVHDGVGESLQAGADMAISQKVSLNVDVKKIFFRTDADINGGALHSRARLDPWVFSAGVGYRF